MVLSRSCVALKCLDQASRPPCSLPTSRMPLCKIPASMHLAMLLACYAYVGPSLIRFPGNPLITRAPLLLICSFKKETAKLKGKRVLLRYLAKGLSLANQVFMSQ